MLANQLFMSSRQKTFSLAASTEMVPNARIVVWGLLNNGEIIADSLSFHVAGIRNYEVSALSMFQKSVITYSNFFASVCICRWTSK